MSGFNYKGKSTATIIDGVQLMLATYDSLTEFVGHERESLIGETTATRSTPNDYGAQYNNPSYTYALIKSDNEPFTDDEQIEIEAWLSSPKTASPLELIDCDGNVIHTYLGKFISTMWQVAPEGYSGVVFTFQCSSPYPYDIYTSEYEIDGSGTITLDCKSDELEEYTYPTITFYAPSSTQTVVLTNTTDNNNTMTLTALDRLLISMDCDHCILTDATGSVINFSDLGWDDVGNIYWLRLVSGENVITVTGTVNITITYKGVVKKAGDWL